MSRAVHYAHPRRLVWRTPRWMHLHGAHWPLCNEDGRGVLVTYVASQATCKRCRHILDEFVPVEADGDAEDVFAPLRETVG